MQNNKTIMSKKIIHFLKNKFFFRQNFKMLPSKDSDAVLKTQKPYVTINHKDDKMVVGKLI